MTCTGARLAAFFAIVGQLSVPRDVRRSSNRLAELKTRFSVKTLMAITACVAFVLAAFFYLAPGVTVKVRNGGNSPLLDLQVHVTGKSYSLGDIKSGEMNRCTVNPTGESLVEISYRLTDGTSHRHSVDCYYEPGDRGVVDAEIRDDDLTHSSHQ